MSNRPHLVFLNRFYWPDLAATGQMLTDLSEDLAAEGWQITVITGRTGYASATPAQPTAEIHKGVRIVRVAGTRFGRTHLVGRMLDYLSYLVGAAFALLRAPRGSIIVGMSDPPLIAALAVVFARLRGGKAVYWVQDLFPDLAVRLRTLKEGGVAHRLTAALADAIHRRCDLVVTLGPAMAEALRERGTPPSRVRVIHNWADVDSIVPVGSDQNPFARAHGTEGRFVVQYSGNAGRAHTFDAVCRAMEMLRDEPDILFQFIGGGRRTPQLKAAAARAKLTNVEFLDYLPRDELRYSLSAASASLVTEDSQVVGLLVPSKTYGILASGRPILFVGADASDVAAIIRDADCGCVIDPNDPGGLARTILAWRDDPALAQELGARGRLAAETKYNRRTSTSAWAKCLASLDDPRLVPVSAGYPRPHTERGERAL